MQKYERDVEKGGKNETRFNSSFPEETKKETGRISQYASLF